MPIIHVKTTDLMHYNDEVYGFYGLSCSAFAFFLRGRESFERESNTSMAMGNSHIQLSQSYTQFPPPQASFSAPLVCSVNAFRQRVVASRFGAA